SPQFDGLPELMLEALGDQRDVGLVLRLSLTREGHGNQGQAHHDDGQKPDCFHPVSSFFPLFLCPALDRALDSHRNPRARPNRPAQLCRRRRAISAYTARTTMAPMTTFCHSWGMDRIRKPLTSTLMMKAPMTVPRMLPVPPLKEVPPMTTAAMASSS